MAREAILKAAMEAGCDEAERLGYGSALGYAEAASIGEGAATVALDYSPLTDEQWERVLWWLHKPVPPGPGKALDETIIRAINAWRGQ